jgi:hypothetical protein
MHFRVSHGIVQGQTHPICQDYATSSVVCGLDLTVKHNPIAIVSDGCSAVPDSDVGARLIALTARRTLESLIGARTVPTLDVLGDSVLHGALRTARHLGVPEISCAATLLTAFVLDAVCHVYFFGDGVWFRRLATGEVFYTVVEASTQAGYLALPNSHAQEVVVRGDPGDCTVERVTLFRRHWSFPAAGILAFGVASDGVCATDRSIRDVIESLSHDRAEYAINQFLNTHPMLRDDLSIATIRID